MERTAIRFRVCDLLLATTLVATYLAGMVYAVRHLKPGELDRESFGLIATLIVFVATLEFTIRFARHRLRPFQLSVPLTIPWVPLFVASAILFVVALGAGWLMDGAFFVISIPFLALVLMVLLHRNVYANDNGLLFLSIPWLWAQVELIPSSHDTLQLCLKPKWLRLTAEVCGKDRERVMELVASADLSSNASKSSAASMHETVHSDDKAHRTKP